MLNTNIKQLRKAKNFSQEELAVRLNVVRQTVSKWEKGLSVPDADLLIQLADVLEVPVSSLLGEQSAPEPLPEAGINAVVEQLVRINEHLAIRNHRTRRIWKVVLAAVITLLVAPLLLLLVASVSFSTSYSVAVFDYPTQFRETIVYQSDDGSITVVQVDGYENMNYPIEAQDDSIILQQPTTVESTE
ncbi:MAG: helix-turn-helix domain-containing protein [Oscillospiraceae bacterium]|nr:helix-turn-helix domain-containing protein [Oscillospiraceae bacterium]